MLVAADFELLVPLITVDAVESNLAKPKLFTNPSETPMAPVVHQEANRE
jgi:hypothetical protein